jgi:hypothetical protein
MLDLAELMCYTKKVIGDEGSGLRGKLATGKSTGLVENQRLNRCPMAGLPMVDRRLGFDGMMRVRRSGFF